MDRSQRIDRISQHNHLYADVLTFLKRYQNIFLMLENIVLWRSVKQSLCFYILVHFVFWGLVYCPVNYLFLISILCILISCFEIVGKVFKFKKDNSEDKKTIVNIEDIAVWITYTFVKSCSFINSAAPLRKRRPLLFYICSLFVGFVCIWVGISVNFIHILYFLLNIMLLIPAFVHYEVYYRVALFLKPYVKRLEEEFDKKPLEDPKQRQKEEEYYWKDMTYKGQPVLVGDDVNAWPELLEDREGKQNSDDERSESQFLNDIFPSSLKNTSAKGTIAVNDVTRDMVMDHTQEDLASMIDSVLAGEEKAAAKDGMAISSNQNNDSLGLDRIDSSYSLLSNDNSDCELDLDSSDMIMIDNDEDEKIAQFEKDFVFVRKRT